MKPLHYILRGREVVPCDDLMAWAEWFENADNRIIARSEIGPYAVSTVFLGLDHGWFGPPLHFETMVFGKEPEEVEIFGRKRRMRLQRLDGLMTRYTTFAEAVAGHNRVCDEVRAALAATTKLTEAKDDVRHQE